LERLQVGADSLYGLRPRVPAVAEVEHKSWISNRFPAETGWSCVTLAKKFLNLSEQMHGSIPYSLPRLGGSILPNAIPTCLGTFLLLKVIYVD